MANMTVPSWALPTTGNLANDDYRRAETAWNKNWTAKNPYTGAPDISNGYSQAQMEEMGNASNASRQAFADQEAWMRESSKAFLAQLTPQQRAERQRLYDEAYAKNKKRGQLAALAAFGGIAGAGMLGAGMIGVGGVGGAGAAAGGDLGMAGWMGAGAGEMGLEAGAAGLASSGAGAGAAATAGDLGMAGWMGTGAGEMGLEAGTAGLASSGASAASTPWASFMKTLTSPGGQMATKAGGSLLSQLISAGSNAYMGNKQAGQYDDVINQINQLYAPDSPYAKQMQQSLARKDAAAGRNSQYGSRAVELAAALTQAKSNALTSPGYGSLLANRGTNQNSTINGFLAALGSGPGQDLITKAGSGIGNYFQSMMGSEGEKYSPWQPNTGFDNSWMQSYAPG